MYDFSFYYNTMNDIYIVGFHIHVIAKNDEQCLDLLLHL